MFANHSIDVKLIQHREFKHSGKNQLLNYLKQDKDNENANGFT